MIHSHLDPWINTQLVDNLYLKSMGGHLVIDQLWEAHCSILFILHNNTASSSYLDGVMECFYIRWFKRCKTSVC